MSERNVEALAKLYGEWLDDAVARMRAGVPAGGADATGRRFAEFAASRGVLVPSALTDGQAIVTAGPTGFDMRPLLERIAKGKTAQEIDAESADQMACLKKQLDVHEAKRRP